MKLTNIDWHRWLPWPQTMDDVDDDEMTPWAVRWATIMELLHDRPFGRRYRRPVIDAARYKPRHSMQAALWRARIGSDPGDTLHWIPYPKPGAQGWQCPRCYAVNAPHVDRCSCSPAQMPWSPPGQTWITSAPSTTAITSAMQQSKLN